VLLYSEMTPFVGIHLVVFFRFDVLKLTKLETSPCLMHGNGGNGGASNKGKWRAGRSGAKCRQHMRVDSTYGMF